MSQWDDPGYSGQQYQQPQYRHQAPPPRRQGIPVWVIAAVVILAVAGGAAFFLLRGNGPAPAAATGSSSQPAAQPAGQPETEAGVRAAATQFYAFYSAGLWPQAWAMLTPASQAAAPQDVYAAVHQGCPSASAGMAREIKSVTMAGPAAVVTETIAGVAAAIGTQADAWQYAGGRWGYVLTAATTAAYSHGSAAADIAALKAAGECAGTAPSLAPLPTVAAS